MKIKDLFPRHKKGVREEGVWDGMSVEFICFIVKENV